MRLRRVPVPHLLALPLLALANAALLTQPASAAEVRGIVESIAGHSQAMMILDSATGQSQVVAVTQDTVFVNARSLRDFAVNDIVVAETDASGTAVRLTRAVVPVRLETTLATAQVAALIASAEPYVLVDARTRPEFDGGHIPTAIHIDVAELARSWQRLPADRGRLIVFYGSGST